MAKATAESNAPKDAQSLYEDVLKKVNDFLKSVRGQLDTDFKTFQDGCKVEKSSADYSKNIKTAENRKKDTRLPVDLQKKYENAYNELIKPVKLTIRNDSDTKILVKLPEMNWSETIGMNESKSIDVVKWTTWTVVIEAKGEFAEDYETKEESVAIQGKSTEKSLQLLMKSVPKVIIRAPSDGTAVQLSQDGKSWEPLDKERGFDAEAHKPFSMKWKVSDVEADYDMPTGTISTTVGNRGTTYELTIPSPTRKPDPVVSFSSGPGDPAFSVSFTGESEPGKPMTFTAKPRTRVTATFTRNKSSGGNEWFGIDPISFRTGNRGWTTNVVVRQERRPEIQVTNESTVSILLDGRTIEAGAKESFFGNEEEKRTIFAGPATDTTYSFYTATQDVCLVYGKAGSTNAVSIRLEIDGEKMKVKPKLEGRFYEHDCFVSWTNQLERMKSELRKDHQTNLVDFLHSCNDWEKANQPRNRDDRITFADILGPSRCLLIERKIAETLGDEIIKNEIEKKKLDEKCKKSEIEARIKLWVERLNDKERFSETKKKSKMNDIAVWDQMVKIANETEGE